MRDLAQRRWEMPCVRARGDQLSSYVGDLRGLLAGEREEMNPQDKMQAVS